MVASSSRAQRRLPYTAPTTAKLPEVSSTGALHFAVIPGFACIQPVQISLRRERLERSYGTLCGSPSTALPSTAANTATSTRQTRRAGPSLPRPGPAPRCNLLHCTRQAADNRLAELALKQLMVHCVTILPRPTKTTVLAFLDETLRQQRPWLVMRQSALVLPWLSPRSLLAYGVVKAVPKPLPR